MEQNHLGLTRVPSASALPRGGWQNRLDTDFRQGQDKEVPGNGIADREVGDRMSDQTDSTLQLTTARIATTLRQWRDQSDTPDLDEIATSPTYVTLDGRDVPRDWQLSKRYGRLLYLLVKTFQPKSILEIGMATGVSSAYIARARQSYASQTASSHVIVDPFQTTDWGGGGKALLSQLGLTDGIEIVEEPSVFAVPLLEKSGRRFDFVFIDGNHCLDYTLADVLVSDRVLHTGGLLVLDDAHSFGVKPAVRYLDHSRFNLRRILLDPFAVHFLREAVEKRRRFAVYQKISHDVRGADGV